MTRRGWKVRVSATAASDVEQIIQRSAATFGAAQAIIYAETLALAVKALEGGPDVVGVKLRTDIGDGIHTLHIARNGRRGRHMVVFRIADIAQRRVVVLRILHDAMDLARHVPTEDEE